MQTNQNILETAIEYLKGVGPGKGDLLRKELQIFTFADLLFHFPYRYIDKTQFHAINTLHEVSGLVQVRGILRRLTAIGEGRKRRLTALLRDNTGVIELVWFTHVFWHEKNLQTGQEYVAFGKVSSFQDRLTIVHPEMESVSLDNAVPAPTFDPVYPTTEKLATKGLDAKGIRKTIGLLLEKIHPADIPENLPDYLVNKLHFPSRYEALAAIHFPKDEMEMEKARNRLKFEELFFMQLRLLQIKRRRKGEIKGFSFEIIGEHFHTFYQQHLPFELTGAQKRVLKEIRRDLCTGAQMNRLLQGDVGSGKTIVALLVMLMALDNGFQACLMAPTEILARQHFDSIGGYLEAMNIPTGFLSGAVKGKKRKIILEGLAQGQIKIIIGTHALLEEPVQFQNLGLAITDEQHRFGVAQRAELWKKGNGRPPHILVMTATPIPRTLAMTFYGDLDTSVIDELPPGRKPILTQHRTENHRMRVFGFMREEIAKGRQIYVVYPLIEESEALDLANLQSGYEALGREFPAPDYGISIVHGKMKPADKDFEMQRFVKGETQIMIATTVIEVGVNVPNATVMVVENTERFGLSQLHQLRGRVGRGGDQSYCILMSGFKLSDDARQRINIMTSTTDGFKIAEADLKLRGPGNIEGTEQSGVVNFRLADLSKDGQIIQTAREIALGILDDDPTLDRAEHLPLKNHLSAMLKKQKVWSRIS